MAMAAAAAAAQVGVRPLSCGVGGQGIHGATSECNSVRFGLRRSSTVSPFALHHRSSVRGGSAPVSMVVRAVATEKNVETVQPSSTSASEQKTRYHFVIANAKFMLDEEEHFQEQMKERLRYFGEQGREQDFWLVIEPEFLAKFPDVQKRLNRPAVALVSTDATWITFMKLRLDRVLKGSFEGGSVSEALAGSTEVELKFEKPKNWTAPYAKYEGAWWTPFLPPQEQ